MTTVHHHKPHHCQQRRTATGRVVRGLVTTGTLLLVAALLGGGGGITRFPAAHAAPPTAASRASAIAAAVTVGTKVTLPESSIAGPGFAGQAIAWTGTDAAHHLNIRVGGGLQFPTKTTLPETSPFAPALAPVPLGQPLRSAIAWTGTDANRSLNVQIIPGGRKLTLPESSLGQPALDFGELNGVPALLLAWTGTDANHSLNVMPLGIHADGVNLFAEAKTVLRQFSSDAGPTLLSNGFSKHEVWVLGWTTRAAHRLNLATAVDGRQFTSAFGVGLPETSATAPTLLSPNGLDSCISWTGTDAAHHLNVQCTTFAQFPQFPDPARTKTVLPEAALGTQGGAFGGGGSNTGLIAWTGTDPAHHLNVAVLGGL